MLESMSPLSLDELEQHLKSLHERLKYLEKVVVPSRVTKEELWVGRSETDPVRRSESDPPGGAFILRGSDVTTVKLTPPPVFFQAA